MILAIKIYLRKALVPSLYFGGIYLLIVTAFRNAFLGLAFLVFFIPQANIYYKLHSYPYGWMFIDLFLLALLLGILIQHIKGEKSGNEKWIWLLICYSYFTTWISSSSFGLSLPISTSSTIFVDWKNYVRTFSLYFIVLRLTQDSEKKKILLLVVSVAILLLAVKSYRNFSGGDSFSWDKRYGGPFEIAGLGANHFGSFMAAYSLVFLTLGVLDNNKFRRYLFLATGLFSIHPIIFSYSRGAYLGFCAALVLIGVLRVRMLIVILLVIGISWKAVLPESVVDRISMTKTENGELEGSAAGRLELWEEAIGLFKSSPIIGVGYEGFKLSYRNHQSIMAGGMEMTDTHGFFVRTLCEQGIIGVLIVSIVFAKSFFSGLNLYRKSQIPLYRNVGLGFSACVVSLIISNLFGDRFSYTISGCYFWALWGLVDSCMANLSDERVGDPSKADSIGVKEGVFKKLLYP